MKKYLIILFIMFPVILMACDDNKAKDTSINPDVSTAESIVGIWEAAIYDEGLTSTWRISFKDDGTFVWKYTVPDDHSGFSLGSYLYDAAGGILRLTIKGDNEVGDYSKDEFGTGYYDCVVSGNKMTWTIREDGNVIDVVVFSKL